MPKLAFTLASNNPEQFSEFIKTLHHAMIPDWEHKLYVVSQKPLTTLLAMSMMGPILDRNVDVKLISIPPVKRPDGTLYMLAARRAFLQYIAIDDNDYVFWCDDDFRFANGSRSYLHASSCDRIYDSCCYLDDNPGCGIVQHMTFFGGSQAGLKIVPVKGGYFETGIGFMMRGREPPYIDERYNFCGAGNDVSVFITKIVNGYYIARNYNNPTRKKPTNQVYAGNPNKHYDLDYIREKGFIAQTRRIFGCEYQYGKVPPKEIRVLHRIGASLKGFPAFY